MKKYYVVAPKQLELQDVPIPEPGRNQVLVRSRVSAVSVGTELWRYVNGGHYGGEGSACGYNTAGVVEAVGDDVTGLRPGDAVFTPQPHAEFVVADAHQVVLLPPNVDFDSGAFTYLPTLGLHALRAAEYQAGDNVLVIGQGIVGLLAALVSQMVGARLVALELDPARRAVARDAGVSRVVDPFASDARSEMEQVFGDVGPDVIVETSQAWAGLTTAMELARLDTRIAVLSIYRTEPPPETAHELLRATFMDRDRFHNQRIKLIASSNDPGTEYPPDVVRWTIQRNMQYIAAQIGAGAITPGRAITHRVHWDELGDVYERLAAGDHGMLGVTLHWE